MSLFGKNIKYIRQSNGFSQQQFAGLFELSRASIGSYEEGRAEPKIETLIKIANHFHVTVDQLVRGKVDANIKTQDSTEKESLCTCWAPVSVAPLLSEWRFRIPT